MAETKHEKFIRVAEARTNKIIDMMRLLGNCSNKVTYDYTNEDIEKIFGALEDELRKCKAKYKELPENEKRFSLRD